jgi:hypothetical protein
VPKAKGKEMVVRGLPVEVENNLPRAPAQGRIVAHGVRSQPFGGRGAAGENLLPDGPVNKGILIAQQTEQGNALALRDLLT